MTLGDEMKNYPEGEHDDQTDAYSAIFDKPPRWLRLGYRVPLYLLQVLIFVLLFTVIPFSAGLGFFAALELAKDVSASVIGTIVGVWIIGLYVIGGIVLFGVGFGASLSSMINATKRLIKLFRGQN